MITSDEVGCRGCSSSRFISADEGGGADGGGGDGGGVDGTAAAAAVSKEVSVESLRVVSGSLWRE